MAANILNSPQAVEMSVHVIRAFVQMRRLLATHKELTRKLSELESKVGEHDEQMRVIIEAIRQLMAPPEPKKRKIGFLVEEKAAPYGRRQESGEQNEGKVSIEMPSELTAAGGRSK